MHGIVLILMVAARATILWIVLTDLLTTTLDEHGREGNGEPGEQGRSDSVDGPGRIDSSS
jgi:hypothetical protein